MTDSDGKATENKSDTSATLTVVMVVVWAIAGILMLIPREQPGTRSETPIVSTPEQRSSQPHTTTDFTNPISKTPLASPKPPDPVSSYVRPEIANLVTRWDVRPSQWKEEPYNSAIVGHHDNDPVDWFELHSGKVWAQYIITYSNNQRTVTIAEYKAPDSVMPIESGASVTSYGDVYVGKTIYNYNVAGKLVSAEHFDQSDEPNNTLRISRASNNGIESVDRNRSYWSTSELSYNRSFLRSNFGLWTMYGQDD